MQCTWRRDSPAAPPPKGQPSTNTEGSLFESLGENMGLHAGRNQLWLWQLTRSIQQITLWVLASHDWIMSEVDRRPFVVPALECHSGQPCLVTLLIIGLACPYATPSPTIPSSLDRGYDPMLARSNEMISNSKVLRGQ